MRDAASLWAVEEACHNAWPSPREALLGAWLLRASGGPSRRLNSLNPLRGATAEVDAVLPEAERIMARLGQPLRVRVPALVEGLGAALQQRGWSEVGNTCTLSASLDTVADREGAEAVTLSAVPSEGWFALRRLLLDGAAEADRTTRAVVDSLLLPHVFATASVGGEVAAVALGVLSGQFVIMEAVGTAPIYRGRGLAAAITTRLMQWGRAQGATQAALQVVADNGVARRLYDRLGFRSELYRYSYYERGAAALTSLR